MEKWLEVTLSAPPETLEARLIMEGFESWHSQDNCVVLYLSPGDDDSLRRLRALSPTLTARERSEDEWADAWKQYYKPTPIGERLLIRPAWAADAPRRMTGAETQVERVTYLNDPGMAFGTGLHASTRLCLEILETLDPLGKRIFDIGCGSGILGLCALLLGAESAVGIDIDPYAVRTAEENARLNGVEGRFSVLTGDFLADGSLRQAAAGFNIIFSNIIADIIIPLTPFLAPFVKSGACWVTSGIIEGRLDDVLAAAEAAGLSVRCVRVEDGWAAVLFVS